MRVIAGKYKGKKLDFALGNYDIRPTLDRVKEDLFNILINNYRNNLLEGNIVDLFAGSGNFGIECLSRGAKFVIFVDYDINAIKLIRRNTSFIKEKGSFEIIKSRAEDFCKANKKKISLVFLDPPYDSFLIEETFNILLSKFFFTKDCIFITESNQDIVIESNKIILERSKKIGKVFIKIYVINNKEKI